MCTHACEGRLKEERDFYWHFSKALGAELRLADDELTTLREELAFVREEYAKARSGLAMMLGN